MNVKKYLFLSICLFIFSCSKSKLNITNSVNKFSDSEYSNRGVASTNPSTKMITYNKFDNIRAKLKGISTFNNFNSSKSHVDDSSGTKKYLELIAINSNQKTIENPNFKIGKLQFSMAHVIDVDLKNLINAFEFKTPFKMQISKSEFVDLLPISTDEINNEFILSGSGSQSFNGKKPYFKIFLNESGIVGGFFKFSNDEFQLIQNENNLYLAKVLL